MRHILLLLFVLALVPRTCAQSEADLYDGPVVVYSNQHFGGLHLHTNGWGGTFTYGKYRGAKQVLLFSIDAVSMKHDKEIKSFNPVYEDSRSYVYGKLNNFYLFRPGIGKKKIITTKLRKSGVQFGYSYTVGASLGITKPVYLEIGYPSIPYDYLQVERYNPNVHYFDDIYGRAPGFHGLDNLKLHPGAFAKFALNFEYSNTKDRLKGLEAGVTLDAFPNRIPIMADEVGDQTGAVNKWLFQTFYLTLFIGKKYNTR